MDAIGRDSEVLSIYTDFSKTFEKIHYHILLQKAVRIYCIWTSGSLWDLFLVIFLKELSRLGLGNIIPMLRRCHLASFRDFYCSLFLLMILETGKGPVSFVCSLMIWKSIELSGILRTRHCCRLTWIAYWASGRWFLSKNLFLNISALSSALVRDVVPLLHNTTSMAAGVKDLDILLVSKLSFLSHYENVLCKANRLLGLILSMLFLYIETIVCDSSPTYVRVRFGDREPSLLHSQWEIWKCGNCQLV